MSATELPHSRRPFELTTARAAWLAMSVAALSCLPTLGRQPLSWNEAITLTAARRSLPHLGGMLSYTDLPLGPYYLFMHGWVRLLDDLHISVTEAWLRLPSALAAIAAGGVLVVVIGRWYQPRIALLAGTLLAAHPLMTFYAQDARPYALETLTFLASTWALQCAIARPSRRRLTLYTALAIVTVYLHVFAVYGLAAQALLVWAARGSRRAWLVVAGVIGVVTAPLVILASGQTGELGWIPRPTPTEIVGVVTNAAGGIALVLVAAAMAAILLVRRRRPRGAQAAFLTAWALTPPLALVAGDVITPELVARYALIAVPALTAIIAIMATRIGGRLGAALIVTAFLAAVSTTLIQQSRPFKYENYRAAADTISALARPGDAVVFLPISSRVGYDVYVHSEPGLREVTDIALAPGGTPANTDQVGGVDRPSRQLSAALETAPTLFLLGGTLTADLRTLHDPTDIAQIAALRHYHVSQTQRWGDLTLTVLQRS